MNRKMKKGTEAKLKKVSDLVITKCGVDVINEDKFRAIFLSVSKDNGIPVYYHTFEDHYDFILKYFNEVGSQKNILSHLIENSVDKITGIAVEYESGRRELVWGTIKKKVEEVEKMPFLTEVELPQKSVGLFDYKENGDIVIQKGQKKGCDITKPADLKKHFSTLNDYKLWLEYFIEAPSKNPRIVNRDTERDIEVLKKELEKVNKKLCFN
jgi:hypothetical protein